MKYIKEYKKIDWDDWDEIQNTQEENDLFFVDYGEYPDSDIYIIEKIKENNNCVIYNGLDFYTYKKFIIKNNFLINEIFNDKIKINIYYSDKKEFKKIYFSHLNNYLKNKLKRYYNLNENNNIDWNNWDDEIQDEEQKENELISLIKDFFKKDLNNDDEYLILELADDIKNDPKFKFEYPIDFINYIDNCFNENNFYELNKFIKIIILNYPNSILYYIPKEFENIFINYYNDHNIKFNFKTN